MTGTEIKTSSQNERGGGVKAAALFWVGLVALMIATIVVSHFTLGSRDTLLRHVPDDTKIYIHAQGDETDIALRLMPELTGLNPDEAAAFAHTEYGELNWTAILRWGFSSEPDDNERAQLNVLNAQEIGKKTYLVGAANFVIGDDFSLADNYAVRRALANAAGLSFVQGMIDLSLYEPADESRSIAIPTQNLIFALTVNDDGTTTVRTNDADSWSKRFWLSNQQTSATQPPLMLLPNEQTGVSVSLSTADESIANILFMDSEDLSRKMGVPDNNLHDKSLKSLIDTSNGPVSFMMAERQVDNNLQFAAYFPQANPETFIATIEQYINQSLPTTETFVRPDGKTEREFILRQDSITYGPEAYGGIRMLLSDEETDLRYPIKVIEPGILLASDAEMLLLGEKSMENSTENALTCTTGANIETIVLNNSATFSEYLPFLGIIFDLNSVINIVIQRNGDNWVYFCG